MEVFRTLGNPTTMSLSLLLTEDNWQGFDQAWGQLMLDGDPIDDLLQTLEMVAAKRRMPRCLPLVKEHAGLLAENDRHDEAARLLGAALVGGGSPSELAGSLIENAGKAWGQEAWWEGYSELAKLVPGTPDPRGAWRDLDKMMAFQSGTIIFHPAGWGLGEVTGVDVDSLEIAIRFQSGRTDRFPLKSAVEIFDIIDEEDLRAQWLRDPDGLKKRLKKEPLEILRSIVQRAGGSIGSIAIRNSLLQIGVTGNSWTSWWRKARLLAENSEWFRLTGAGQKIEVRLLRRAADPAEDVCRQLQQLPGLGAALTRVRELLVGGAVDSGVEKAALEVLEGMAADERQPEAHRLSAWLLLRDRQHQTPEPLLMYLQEAAEEEVPALATEAPALWARFQALPTVREQERCADLLREVLGEERWLDEAATHLQHAAPGMVKPLTEALIADGRGQILVGHYASLLARPLRSPAVLIALAKVVEEARMEGELPTPPQRAQALIELGVYLYENKRGNPRLQRAHARLVDLLCKGDEPLLRRLLHQAAASTLRAARTSIQRGIDDQIDSVLTDVAVEFAPEIFRSEGRPFWEEDTIWTTTSGLRKRESELRELREVKIPANREAIARAASYGDLSENSEWEQAIEEQRQLTEQASEIEKELRRSSLLSHALIPDQTVCPGSRVSYREIDSGVQRQIMLLGPWDTDRENAVSYNAPLARGMLGLHPGQTASIELPSGTVTIEVLEVTEAEVD